VSEVDDEVPRAAYFLFISAKAMATIEFLQQEWIKDGNFIDAGNERDPIVGLQEEGATFTIPKESLTSTKDREKKKWTGFTRLTRFRNE
jgi:deferrochelatase/peroxidase EfeB